LITGNFPVRGQAITEAEIPAVFRRMPVETLERYAQHGVVGARLELQRRREAQAAVTRETNQELRDLSRVITLPQATQEGAVGRLLLIGENLNRPSCAQASNSPPDNVEPLGEPNSEG
jgi:hypothetical protein